MAPKPLRRLKTQMDVFSLICNSSASAHTCPTLAHLLQFTRTDAERAHVRLVHERGCCAYCTPGRLLRAA